MEVMADQWVGMDLPSFLPTPLFKVIAEILFLHQKTFTRNQMTIDRYKAMGGVLRRTQVQRMKMPGLLLLYQFLTELGFTFPPLDEEDTETKYSKAFNLTGYETTLDIHRGLGMIVGASLSFQVHFMHPIILAKITIERFPSLWWKKFVDLYTSRIIYTLTVYMAGVVGIVLTCVLLVLSMY